MAKAEPKSPKAEATKPATTPEAATINLSADDRELLIALLENHEQIQSQLLNPGATFPVIGQTNWTGRFARITEKAAEAIVVAGALCGLTVAGKMSHDWLMARRSAHDLASTADVPFK